MYDSGNKSTVKLLSPISIINDRQTPSMTNKTSGLNLAQEWVDYLDYILFITRMKIDTWRTAKNSPSIKSNVTCLLQCSKPRGIVRRKGENILPWVMRSCSGQISTEQMFDAEM